MELNITLLREGALPPARATEGSAGYDLAACIDAPVRIAPGCTEKIGTGVAIALPDSGMVALVFGRSGLGIKHGLAPANCVGVIDSDYRGEIIVALHNSGGAEYIVQPGERIAQMVITPILLPELRVVQSLDATERGDGGFGSTGAFSTEVGR